MIIKYRITINYYFGTFGMHTLGNPLDFLSRFINYYMVYLPLRNPLATH